MATIHDAHRPPSKLSRPCALAPSQSLEPACLQVDVQPFARPTRGPGISRVLCCWLNRSSSSFSWSRRLDAPRRHALLQMLVTVCSGWGLVPEASFRLGREQGRCGSLLGGLIRQTVEDAHVGGVRLDVIQVESPCPNQETGALGSPLPTASVIALVSVGTTIESSICASAMSSLS
jgi:hypothetical protein